MTPDEAHSTYLKLQAEELSLFREREVIRERLEQIEVRLPVVRAAVEGFSLGKSSVDTSSTG